MLNRESVFRGDAPLTTRQRQTAMLVVGALAVIGAIGLTFSGVVSSVAHRNDPVAMQVAAGSGTTEVDGAATGVFDEYASYGNTEPGGPVAADDGSPQGAASGGFTGTYRPSKAGGTSPLSPTATSTAPAPGEDPTPPPSAGPAATTGPTVTVAESTSTTATTRAGASTTDGSTSSSSTGSTRSTTTTTTTRPVTVTEATTPSSVVTVPPPTTPSSATVPPPSTAPPSSAVVGGPVA